MSKRTGRMVFAASDPKAIIVMRDCDMGLKILMMYVKGLLMS